MSKSANFCPYCGQKVVQLRKEPPISQVAHPTSARRNGKMAKLIGGALAVIVLVMALVIVLPFFERAIEKPKPVIVFKNVYDTFEGLDYIAVVETRVRNEGGDGWIIVYADFSAGGQYEQKTQRLYLRKGETKYTWFKFDLDFWYSLFGGLIDPETLKMAYRVWAEPA